MPNVVVFDCESDGTPTKIGPRGEQDFRFVQCTCACAMVLNTDRICLPEAGGGIVRAAQRITCWRDVIAHKGADPFAELFKAFDDAELIVGFNTFEFDFPLLYKYYGTNNHARYVQHRLKCLDIFSRIRAATSRWPKLDALLQENDLKPKSGTGADAIKLWNEQRRSELEAYCQVDVQRTIELAMLPRMRMGGAWIPGHVYGVGPAVQAAFVAKAMASTSATQLHDGSNSAAAVSPDSPEGVDWCLVFGDEQ